MTIPSPIARLAEVRPHQLRVPELLALGRQGLDEAVAGGDDDHAGQRVDGRPGRLEGLVLEEVGLDEGLAPGDREEAVGGDRRRRGGRDREREDRCSGAGEHHLPGPTQRGELLVGLGAELRVLEVLGERHEDLARVVGLAAPGEQPGALERGAVGSRRGLEPIEGGQGSRQIALGLLGAGDPLDGQEGQGVLGGGLARGRTRSRRWRRPRRRGGDWPRRPPAQPSGPRRWTGSSFEARRRARGRPGTGPRRSGRWGRRRPAAERWRSGRRRRRGCGREAPPRRSCASPSRPSRRGRRPPRRAPPPPRRRCPSASPRSRRRPFRRRSGRRRGPSCPCGSARRRVSTWFSR